MFFRFLFCAGFKATFPFCSVNCFVIRMVQLWKWRQRKETMCAFPLCATCASYARYIYMCSIRISTMVILMPSFFLGSHGLLNPDQLFLNPEYHSLRLWSSKTISFHHSKCKTTVLFHWTLMTPVSDYSGLIGPLFSNLQKGTIDLWIWRVRNKSLVGLTHITKLSSFSPGATVLVLSLNFIIFSGESPIQIELL